jgi:hypothetical protein
MKKEHLNKQLYHIHIHNANMQQYRRSNKLQIATRNESNTLKTTTKNKQHESNPNNTPEE